MKELKERNDRAARKLFLTHSAAFIERSCLMSEMDRATFDWLCRQALQILITMDEQI
ncbi:MAG: hypothetical protein V1701_02735 [Planctomycetota bacterium]